MPEEKKNNFYVWRELLKYSIQKTNGTNAGKKEGLNVAVMKGKMYTLSQSFITEPSINKDLSPSCTVFNCLFFFIFL